MRAPYTSLLMPIVLKQYGASIAFGLPGVLMALATLCQQLISSNEFLYID